MKAIIQLIIAIMTIAITASANPFYSSSIELSVEAFGNYSFEINGLIYPSRNGTMILDNIAPGQYNVRVFKSENRGRGHYHAGHLIYQKRIVVPSNAKVIGRLGRSGMNVRVVAKAPIYRDVHCNYIGMEPRAYQDLLFVIAQSSFDKTKAEVAIDAMQNHRLTVKQIARILNEFSFDRHRLDVAKFAYQRCLDPQNFYLLANEFTFESNSRELLRYIQQ